MSRLLKASFQAAHKITTDLSQITDPHRQKHRSLRSLKNNLSAGSPLDSCPQAHPLTPVRRLTPRLLSAGSPLDSCPQAVFERSVVFPLWRSEFRRNRGWLVRRARACSQARTDVAYTEVVDLRPPSAVFFLFLSTRQFTSPPAPAGPHGVGALGGGGLMSGCLLSEELESSPPGGS